MGFGSFVLMLHSHLPYYRHHGMWPSGEENVYECMAETYMPLLMALDDLVTDGIRPGITLGITPILAEQLADPHIKQGFVTFLQDRLLAAQADTKRYPSPDVPHSEHRAWLAQWYVQHFETLIETFNTRYQQDLIAGFRRLQDIGAIEITTSAATHGFSPLLGSDAAIQAQFKVGVESYKQHFGRLPKGVWLPECAYRPTHTEADPSGAMRLRPSTDAFLHANGLDYFFTEYHAIEGGVSTGERRVVGIYGDIQYIPLSPRPETGLTTFEAYWMPQYPIAVMGRNDQASFQVWSAAHGYPGDGLYREFHKKDDRSGLHYWRLTSKETDLANKMLYDPVEAFAQTQANADHFVSLVQRLLSDYQQATGEHGLVMVSFDTELFGHWWFEGVAWLQHVIRKLHQTPDIDRQTASEYVEAHPPQSAIALPESTWGQGGHYWVWQNHHTEWMWPIIHEAEHHMQRLVTRYADTTDAWVIRLLNQSLRELLLLESSDWPFLVTTFQAKDYAVERFSQHQERFWELASMLDQPASVEAETILATLEAEDNPFPHIDFRWYTWPSPDMLDQPQDIVSAIA
jgi:1,4-alpha-glucan branching enzyme